MALRLTPWGPLREPDAVPWGLTEAIGSCRRSPVASKAPCSGLLAGGTPRASTGGTKGLYRGTYTAYSASRATWPEEKPAATGRARYRVP